MNKFINYFDLPYQNKKTSSFDEAANYFVANIALSNGSISKELYKPYYNYVPRTLKLTEDKYGLIRTIQSYYFALNDLALYLDVNPDNVVAIDLYNKYVKNFNLAVNQYETKYGPLMLVNNESNVNYFDWIKKWPWEGEDKNVDVYENINVPGKY